MTDTDVQAFLDDLWTDEEFVKKFEQEFIRLGYNLFVYGELEPIENG